MPWLSRRRTIQEAAGVKGLQGDELQRGAWHGRLGRQVARGACRSRVKLRRADAAHLLHERPAQEHRERLTGPLGAAACTGTPDGESVCPHLTKALLPTLAAPMM